MRFTPATIAIVVDTRRESIDRTVAERRAGRGGSVRHGTQQRAGAGDDRGRGGIVEQTSGEARPWPAIGGGVAEEHSPGELRGNIQEASLHRHGPGQAGLGGRAGGSPGDPEAGASQAHPRVRQRLEQRANAATERHGTESGGLEQGSQHAGK